MESVKEVSQMSYFDGGLLEQIIYQLGATIITAITFGICYPWAICFLYKWKMEHTVIEGRRLTFKGTGISLFGNWLKWLLLTIMTLGIYSFWLGIALEKWKTKNTFFLK